MDFTYYKCNNCGNKLSPEDANKYRYECPLCNSPLEKGLGRRSAYYLNSISYPEIDKVKCTKCAICEKVCPAYAITMTPYPTIDQDKCIICKLCALKCPEKAIS